MPADFRSELPAILSRYSPLPAIPACDGEEIVPGRIYVAPPDRHLLVQPGVTRLSHGPKENWVRPAIDPLFRSAAETYGERVVGVVLTGALYDGTAGLITIKRYGGVTIVQDPAEAAVAAMPISAINRDHPDFVLPLSEIAIALVRLTQEMPETHVGGKGNARPE